MLRPIEYMYCGFALMNGIYIKEDLKGGLMLVRPEVWISEPDCKGNGFLKAWMVDGEVEFPMPIETHNVSIEEVKIDEEQDFDFILECANIPKIYEDEKAYAENAQSSMASESVIPVGLFSPPGEDNKELTPHIMLNGRVVETYEDSTEFGFDESDVLYSLTCMGNEYDAVMHEGHSDGVVIKEGNTVSCVYWVQGWPAH